MYLINQKKYEGDFDQPFESIPAGNYVTAARL
jgi:hypothetical protein